MSDKDLPSNGFGDRFAELVYRWRWISTAIVLLLVGGVFARGMGLVGAQTRAILEIGDVSDGRGALGPQLFDPSLDVWFTGDDETIRTFREIEDRFVAEDYLVVAFEAQDTPNGVFDRQALDTIARLTDALLRVPGVRHVRSLTHNPWIRWGAVETGEQGLIITDLVEAPASLSEDDLVERMVAVLGAPAVVARVGEARVRAVLGQDADFGDHFGEPLLLGTLVNEAGTATAIQVQMIRPFLSGDSRNRSGALASKLYSVQSQRGALRAVEHILRREAGLVVPTDEHRSLLAALPALPSGPEKDRLQRDLEDPTKVFVLFEGEPIRKYHEYRADQQGRWVDALDPEQHAPAGFSPEPSSPYSFRLAGVPTFERNFEITGAADAGLLPLSWLIIFLGLFFLCRSVAGAVIPMIVVIVAILGTVGGVFLSGHLFNNMTAMLPNMLTVIGVADSVHLVATYLMLRHDFTDRRRLITAVIRRNALPVFLTSITTAVGFYSLVLIKLEPVQEFAVAMGFASLLAYLVTMTLVPLLLSFVPLSARRRPKRKLAGLFSADRSELLAAWVVDHKRGILLATLVLTVLTLKGLSSVEIDADPRTMFPDDNKVMVEMDWIEHRLGGVGDLELVFSAPPMDPAGAPSLEASRRLEALRVARIGHQRGVPGFEPLSAAESDELARLGAAEKAWRAGQIGLSPSFLGQLDRFEKRLRGEMADPGSPLRFITDLTSPLDILRKIHQVQNENLAEHYRIPGEGDVHPQSRGASIVYDDIEQRWLMIPAQDAATLVAQYYLQYENGARPGENLASQLSSDRRHFRMQGRLAMASSNQRQQTYTRLREIAAEEFPELARGAEALSTLSLSGKTMMVDLSGLEIATSYTKSVALALVVICAFIGIVFRSVRFAVLSLVPNVFPILVPVSVLGLLGVALDGPAIVACSIALGLCVDDTIHLFSKFRDAEAKGLRGQEAIAYGFRECGNAVAITTGVLVFGFLSMTAGDFSPNVYIGLLGSVMIVIAFIADFIVTPAVLAASERFRRPALRPAVVAVSLVILCLAPGLIAQPDGPSPPPPPPPPPLPTGVEADGRALMVYADSFDSGWRDEVLQGEMTLVDAAGRTVQRAFVRMALERGGEGGTEGEKVITRFTSPNDIRGVSALTFENRGGSDDNWLYLPATKRVRRISGANNTSSFQGTEFTYEDLSSLDPQEYQLAYLGEAPVVIDGVERATHKIDAVPTYVDTGYSRLEVYLDPVTWRQVRIDYFDLAGTLLKTRLASHLERFHDRYWRAGRIEMHNHQSGKRTILEIDGYLLDLSQYPDSRTGEPRQGLDDSQFTTRSLVR